MHDLVIRGATVVDGTGSAAREADVAVDDGLVSSVGQVTERGKEELDAKGKLVTPGFVDIHTHYDGQATWDPLLTPTSWHGVTTAVMGNCGVGFAPVRPGGAVRAYVMGERGAKNEPANENDIAEMAAIVKEAVAAGALGFSMSRTLVHRAVDGEVVPGTHATEDEIFGICRGLGDLGKGLVELAPAGVQGEDMSAPDREIDWMARLSNEIKRPVSFALVQHDVAPQDWRRLLDLCAKACASSDAVLRPQVGSRATTLLIGDSTFHPFSFKPTYGQLGLLSPAERMERLRDPELRRQIINEDSVYPVPQLEIVMKMIENGLDKVFRLGDPPNYEPAPEESLKATAAREGRDPYDLLFDWLFELGGRQLLMLTLLGYSNYDLEPTREMLEHPLSAFGLGDGGAHCGAICDASMTTSLLEHWTKRRTRGPKLPIEWAVKKMTHDTASLYGMTDRGQLVPGKKADINVIDYDRLSLALPELVADLPAGAARLVQKAHGYEATIVSGQTTFREGEHTGALPGRVVRS
jgi:N-acyl-D-aspartate/D-glutamate deacylase